MALKKKNLPTKIAPVKNLVFSPHPLLAEPGRRFEAMGYRHGETLAEFLGRSPIDTALPLRVMLDDVFIPRNDWGRTLIKPDALVTVRTMVQGGDDSNPVQTILTIAVLVYAPQMGAALNTSMGLAANAYLGTALVTIGGMYLVSQLFEPPTPLGGDDGQTSPNYSISGGSNRSRLMQPLALVIGQHRMFPDLGAKPFTYNNRRAQHLLQVFNFGLSDLVLTDYKIGDTALTSFSDYDLEVSAADGVLDTAPGNVDSTAGAALVLDTWLQRTSSTAATRLVVNLAGLLFWMGPDGVAAAGVSIDAQYRAVGSGTWIDFDGFPWVFFSEGAEPLRWDAEQAVTSGQYEVQVRFSSPQLHTVTVTGSGYSRTITPIVDINDPRATITVNWSELLTHQADNADYTGQQRAALDIRASSQLSGVINAFNALASARCESWNGSAWATTENSNPAWWFRWLANGAVDSNGRRLFGAGYSDAQLDLDTIKAWGAWCDTKSLSVNLIFDQPKNCYDMLSIIARCGRASLSWGSGQLGVVYDQANQPAAAVFGMSNIRKDSFKVEYISGQLPDEIVLNWINPALGYQPDTVRQALPGVTNPQNPVTVTIPGITNETQAGRECNLIAAEQEYRTRVITWETDIEGLAVSRGDVAMLSHDLTQWGYSGRLLAGTTTVLTLDRSVPFTVAAAHYIGVRFPDGSYNNYPVAIQVGESDTLTLTSPLPSAPDADVNNPAIDYIWCFEPLATPGKAVKITDIKPVSEHHVRIVATDEDDQYYLAENDTYTYITPNNYSVSLPTISNLTIVTKLIRAGSGYLVEFGLAWDASGEYGGAFIRGGINDVDITDRGKTLDKFFSFTGPPLGKVNIEVTCFNKNGQFGATSRDTLELVYIGHEQPPEDPTGLVITFLDSNVRQLQPTVAELPVDFAGFLYRARAGTWTTWDQLSEVNGGIVLHDQPIKDLPWLTPLIPAGTYTVGVKVADETGNESVYGFVTATVFPAAPNWADYTAIQADAQGRADLALATANLYTEGWSTENATVGADWVLNLTNRPADADLLNENLVHTADITVTVGSGGDYPTLNAALAGLAARFPTYADASITAEVSLLSGYVVTEQITVDGLNLSWITITGIDAETVVDRASMTVTNFPPYKECFVAALNGGKAPVISQLFNMNTSGPVPAPINAFLANGAGSTIIIAPGCGFKNLRGAANVWATKGAIIDCSDSIHTSDGFYDSNIYAGSGGYIDAQNCSIGSISCFGAAINIMYGTISNDGVNSRMIDAGGGGRVLAENVTLTHIGTTSNASQSMVTTNGASHVDMDNATINGINYRGYGITAQEMSVISAANCNFSGALTNGIRALSGSIINAGGGSGTLSQAANTVLASGIIFR